MTIGEAIEILSDSAYRGITTFTQDFIDAEKLGIEALRAIRRQRNSGPTYKVRLLPGESIITLLSDWSLPRKRR